MSDHKRLVNWIVGSLSNEPEKWEFDGYFARHKSGVCIWVANEAYGLYIVASGNKIGGATGWSSFFGWLGWRGRVYRAAMNAQVARILQTVGAA